MKRRAQPSAPALLACPYDRKGRFKSLKALNVHIAAMHRGHPPVTIKAVLLLVLSGYGREKRSMLDLILPDA